MSDVNALDGDLLQRMEALHSDSYGWSLACCGHDPHEAKDVLQTAYLKVLRGDARFVGRSSFKTWLFGVIRMTALDQRRRRWRWSRIVDRLRKEPAADISPEGGTSPSDAHSLGRALAGLPGRQREVLHLVFYQEMTLAEAAEAMGVSAGTAAQHYARGKEALRRTLSKTSLAGVNQ